MVLYKILAQTYNTYIHAYVYFEGIASCIFLFDLHSLSRSTWRCHMVFSGNTTCSYSHAKGEYLYFHSLCLHNNKYMLIVLAITK